MVPIKVAIMGAGLSGLSCAITLERNGIAPTIFESRSKVGDRFVNGEIFLSILERPINDPIAFLADQYGIYLSPVGNIKRMLLHSENEEASIEGNLGFSTLRGRDEDSIESQLARQVKSRIVFNSTCTYEELLQEFTHVVVAAGDAAYAAKIQSYQEDLTVTLRGTTVEGRFDRYTVGAWLDNNIAPQGYGFMVPLSEKEASIAIAYPDYPENREKDIDTMWSLFYERTCKDLKQDLRITDKFEITRYIIGICKHPRIGNTFFTGNCFGSIMPFMGFGQFIAIMTGIYAAHDLCGLGSYEELTKPIRKSYNSSLVLRRVMERLDNANQDFIVRNADRNIVERIFNTKNIKFLKYASHLLRPLAANMHKKV